MSSTHNHKRSIWPCSRAKCVLALHNVALQLATLVSTRSIAIMESCPEDSPSRPCSSHVHTSLKNLWMTKQTATHTILTQKKSQSASDDETNSWTHRSRSKRSQSTSTKGKGRWAQRSRSRRSQSASDDETNYWSHRSHFRRLRFTSNEGKSR